MTDTVLTQSTTQEATPPPAETTAAPEAQAAPETPTINGSQPSVQSSAWTDALPEELKQDPSISKFESIADLAKSYKHAQKMVGGNKIAIPDKHATPDDWKNVYQALGLPENVEEYSVEAQKEAAETIGLDDEFMGWYKQKAHELGILPHQAQDLLNSYTEMQAKTVSELKQQQELTLNETVQNLQKEWGQAFESKISAAQRAVKEIGGDELAQALNATGAGNDPRIIKAFTKVAEMLKEDAVVKGEPYSGVMSPAEAIEKARQIMGDSTHPYNNPAHPNHKAAHAEVTKLYQVAYPEE